MDTSSPQLLSKKYTPDENRITYFAETDARNRRVRFGIKAKDRPRHVYVIGKTGMGKSTLLENLAIQDIQNGEGIAFVDPHGKSAELLLDYVPKERMKDVLYFAPFDMDHPISFNVMEDVGADRRHLVVSGLMSAFKKIWVDAWSARMEYILGNTLLALLEFPDSTLLGINRMLSDKIYRKKVVDNIKDPSVKSFWVDEFAKYTDRFAAEATPAIQNKVGQFTSNPLIRNIIGQPHSTFDLRKMMDERKIVIINLSKGRVGESNADLLGSMLITKIYLAAMSRADTSESNLKNLPNFYLYVDEFQSFANESFADILSEARKYKLNLTIAHQYIEQMSEEVRASVFGNVGTMICFRVGAFDAEILEKEFAPQFTAEDMVNLGFAQVYLKLMIDGVSSPPFSATTLPPISYPATTLKTEIIKVSREQFGHSRAAVEEAISRWHETARPLEKLPHATKVKEEVAAVEISKSPARGSFQSAQGTTNFKPSRTSPEGVSVAVPPTQNDSHQKFKSDLKGFLKTIGQRDVVAESASANIAPQELVREEEKARPERISLNDLQRPPMATPSGSTRAGEAFRNSNKTPTPENLAGLRSALASALKPQEKNSGAAPVGSPPHAPHKNHPVQKPTRISESVVREGQEKVKPSEAVSGANQTPPLVTEEPIVKDSPPFKIPQPRREVPPEVLRKILESE